MTKSPKIFREFEGIVVGDKMNKTVVVRVDRIKKHPRYKKGYIVSKRYKAHDERGEYKFGDVVVIREVRPLSREKKWVVIKKIGKVTPKLRSPYDKP